MTGRYLGGDRRDLTASYVRSHGTADLNNYDQFYGNLRNPFLRANEHNLIPTDVPHRVIIRGTIGLPGRGTSRRDRGSFGVPVVGRERIPGILSDRGIVRAASEGARIRFPLSRPWRSWKYRFRGGMRVYNSWRPPSAMSRTNMTSPNDGRFFNPIHARLGSCLGPLNERPNGTEPSGSAALR